MKMEKQWKEEVGISGDAIGSSQEFKPHGEI